MQALREFATSLSAFLDSGGPVLWGLFAVSILLWFMIIERYLYLAWGHRRHLQALQRQWSARREHTSWYAQKIRRAMISEVSLRLNAYLRLIRAMIVICPLLGLLGTVTGMIQVFDVMAHVGSGNARAMANGVSMATIPTMGGMVIALSGYFFASHLQRAAVEETEKAADVLRRRLG